MLSSAHEPVIRATAPVVAGHLDEISSEFYDSLLSENPQLWNVFSRSAQASGEQKRALAGAVAGFALSLIGAGPPMNTMFERVANRHASLGIQPEQYTVVGRYLMRAVGKVLGDAVTPEVAAAWDEVYWLMACKFIGMEARLYATQGVEPTSSFRDHEVSERIEEAFETVSFVLTPVDGTAAPHFRPGQYVTVAVDLPDGGRQLRQYSLSQAPGAESLRITVRRVRGTDGKPDGLVSGHLIEHLHVGSKLPVSPPFGNLTPQPGHDPLLLISAGVGITPMASILGHLAESQPERQVVAVHAERSAERHPLRVEMLQHGSRIQGFQQQVWYETGAAEGVPSADVRTGRVLISEIPLPDNAEAYLCGPIPFMRGVRAGLLERGVTDDRIRYEVFGSDHWQEAD
ncbi:hemin transporter [Kineosporia sp. NBRC 101677]|uniref:globin domain-containing protein n=1 Tax=Kineosporia sp. NBRC 101677 TaxID=3032197 RepID=UPI0024A42021|nr:globin domain-containing protein [Kineosporia sp. NBRC 101677]GLY19540.1 hemin transporter [Kineosporia sp. NBRC 101677]